MRDSSILRLQRLSACLLLVLGCVQAPLAASGQSDEQRAWDQERVTELAVQLAVATRELRREIRRDPTNRGRTQDAITVRLRDHLRVIEHETRFLASELQAGVIIRD